MARHYVSINRGFEGGPYVDYHFNTTEPAGTAPAGTDLFVFSVLDGVTPTKTEILKAIEAFERFFENPNLHINQAPSLPYFDIAG